MQMISVPPPRPPFGAVEVGCSETAPLSFTSLIRAAPAQKTSADTSHTSIFPPQTEESGFRNKKKTFLHKGYSHFMCSFPPLFIASTVLFSYQGILWKSLRLTVFSSCRQLRL